MACKAVGLFQRPPCHATPPTVPCTPWPRGLLRGAAASAPSPPLASAPRFTLSPLPPPCAPAVHQTGGGMACKAVGLQELTRWDKFIDSRTATGSTQVRGVL